MKRDMEELKKDVESVKALTGQKSFLGNAADMNLLETKIDVWRPAELMNRLLLFWRLIYFNELSTEESSTNECLLNKI